MRGLESPHRRNQTGIHKEVDATVELATASIEHISLLECRKFVMDGVWTMEALRRNSDGVLLILPGGGVEQK